MPRVEDADAKKAADPAAAARFQTIIYWILISISLGFRASVLLFGT